MALTDIKTIKKIIQTEKNFIPTIFNERIKLTFFEKSLLPHSNIVEDSESVKIILQAAPTLDSLSPITLAENSVQSLSNPKIVWNTVVVSDSLLLNTIYAEHKDYIIDYFNGTIERASSGSSILTGQQVYIWYVPFTLLTLNNDYNFDYNSGEINRRAGSSIPNKATVYVDYTHSESLPSDDTIIECIYEMESFIQNKLKPPFDLLSDDRALKSASTNFVLYLLSLSQAFKELTIASRSTSDDIAKQWFSLADKYLKVATDLFGPFLRTSTKQFGGLIENRFVKNRSRKIQSPTVPITIRRH